MNKCTFYFILYPVAVLAQSKNLLCGSIVLLICIIVYVIMCMYIQTCIRMYLIQYSSGLSWHSCVVNTHVFFNFCWVTQSNSYVKRNGLHINNLRVLHATYILCTAHDPCILCVLHNSKKQTSNTSCAACESVFLCAACKLTAIFAREESRHTMKWHASKTW